MNTRSLTPFLALGLLVACDEAPPNESDPNDTGTADTVDGDATVDTSPDTTPDVEEDTAPDVVEDTAPDVAPDVVEDTADVAETTPDVADVDAADTTEDVEVVDVGTSCAAEPTICEAPYTCIDDVCRVSPAESTWAESAFSVEEPEELSRLFDVLKSLTSDVKFLVLDIGPGNAALPVTYGSADLVEGESELPLVQFQVGEDTGAAILRAHTPEDDALNGLLWVTDPFLYELRATATVDFGEPVSASFGLNAEEVVLTMTTNDGSIPEVTSTTALLVGTVTREEAEGRYMVSPDEFPAFATLFCDPTIDHDPGDMWHLSDVLDCNGAVMDTDFDEDGTMDAYRVVIEATFEPAILVE